MGPDKDDVITNTRAEDLNPFRITMRCLADWRRLLQKDGVDRGSRAVSQFDLINIIDEISQAPGRLRAKTNIALIVAVVVGVGLTACRREPRRTPPPAKNAKPATTTPADPPVPMAALPSEPAARGARGAGGVLHVHLDSEPPTLDPLADPHAAIPRVVEGTVYETLIECRGDHYEPRLADRWDVSPDGLRISLHLRPGVRWHDDKPLGPMDVQATFERLLRSTSPLPAVRALLADVDAIEVAPERIARVRLKRPSGLALRALCDVPIQPEHQLRAGTAALAAIGRTPNGTGPFRFGAWERGKRIRLVRARSAAVGGPPLDEISFEIDPDPGRALARARRGDLDVIPRVLDVHFPEQVSGPAVRDRFTVYRLTPERHSFLVLNHDHPPLDDRAFRHALSEAWDRERLATELRRGLARPIVAPPFGPLVPDLPAPLIESNEGPKRAAATLEAAGYRDSDADGVRDRDGQAIRLTILQPAGAKAAAAEIRAYALALRKAGVLLDVATVDAATLLARVTKGDFDLAPFLWDGRPDDDPRPLYGSGAEYNHSRYRSDSIGRLLDELRLQPGPAERAPVLHRIAEVLASDVPVVFLYRHDVPALVGRQVRGLAGSGDRLDLRGVWLAP